MAAPMAAPGPEDAVVRIGTGAPSRCIRRCGYVNYDECFELEIVSSFVRFRCVQAARYDVFLLLPAEECAE